ncbi:ABC transporter permease [Mycoplasmopsis columbinasalis]|uniref:Uncharacterized ABC transporter permease MG468 homolog n=1 Tax=Mycoplasmopsis columbinasalis TaxID=114880 RepID=A0A449BAS1_9BACT|nr:ABC transporter permease [Mycoplasmopsis columbinasalis]VEU78127.1 Uncharacterized ABC transporter permease MG468 homolog [Mycoplasmopsis columbinasalis]
MWRLFKEVFKSLTKNKVVVIGLSILLFFTTAIFTLLTSVRRSMVNSFTEYKNKSVLQDVTVDLNLSSSGEAYNQGYFINGESYDDLKEVDGKKVYEPIRYIVNYDKTFQGEAYQEWKKTLSVPAPTIDQDVEEYKDKKNVNILYVDNIKGDYLPLNKIKSADVEAFLDEFSSSKRVAKENFYIKKSDLRDFYRYSQNADSSVKFNLQNINDPYFEVSNEWRLKVFVLNSLQNNDIKPLTITHTLKADDVLHFNSPLELKKLAIFNEYNQTINATQVGALFVNVETKEITKDFTDGIEWINQGIGKKIDPQTIMTLLGFTNPNQNNPFYYEYDRSLANKRADLLNDSTNNDISQAVFKNNITAGVLFPDVASVTTLQEASFSFKPGTKYNLSQEYVWQHNSSTEFWRWNYYTSYTSKNDARKKWSGTYKTFIESLGDPSIANRNPLWDQLETFSHWKKLKSESWIPFRLKGDTYELANDANSIITKNTEVNIASNNDFMESSFLKLYTNDTRTLPIDVANRNAYKIEVDDAKTILEIEKYNNPFLSSEYTKNTLNAKDAFYNLILDSKINVRRLNIIKEGALKITKNSILDATKELVGVENIGLKETTTVDGVNAEGNKNVYHFINTGQTGEGENKFVVDGIPTNVGKLFNEQTTPTVINEFHETDRTFFSDYQIPPAIIWPLIAELVGNHYLDKEYIMPVVSYQDVWDENPVTHQTTIHNKVKVVALNKYVDPTTNTDGSKTPDYRKTNLYIYTDGFFFKFAKFEEKAVVYDSVTGNKVQKENIYVTRYFTNEKPIKVNGYDGNFMRGWLIANNYTIATDGHDEQGVEILKNGIKTDGDGWGIKVGDTVDIHRFYWNIDAELNNAVLKEQDTKPLLEAFEKVILNLDFVKNGFLSSDLVYQLTPLFTQALNKVNFASAFLRGRVDSWMLPKIFIYLINNLATNPSGNLIKLILDNAIKKVKELTSLNTGIEVSRLENLDEAEIQKVKEYFKSQVINLLKTLQLISTNNISPDTDYSYLDRFFAIFNNPFKFLQVLSNLVNVFDINKLEENWITWFDKFDDKKIAYNGEMWTQKLTLSTILANILTAIDGNILKNVFYDAIDQVNLDKILAPNETGLIYNFLQNQPVIQQIYKILVSKLDPGPNNDYEPVVRIIKSLIRNFDFDYFKGNLEKYIQTKYVKWEYRNKTQTSIYSSFENYAFRTLETKDLIKLIFESLFNASGTNKAFKENIISLFNLSGKMKVFDGEIQSDGSTAGPTTWIWDEDKNKISVADLLSAISIKETPAESTTTSPNTPASVSTPLNLTLEQTILELKQKIAEATGDEINLDNLQDKYRSFIGSYVESAKIIFNKKALETALDNLLKFIAQTKRTSGLVTNPALKTGADWIVDMQSTTGTGAWSLVKTTLSKLLKLDSIYNENFAKNVFSIYTPYLTIYTQPDTNQAEANQFVRDFLEFAVSAPVLAKTQEANKNINIAFSDQTDYYISRFLSTPATQTIFDQNQDGTFLFAPAEELALANPKYRQFIHDYKLMLILQLGYIGQAAKYSKPTDSDNPKDSGYFKTINGFYNNYLSTPEFYAVKDAVFKINTQLSPAYNLEFIGISGVLFNPVLLTYFPEIAISYLIQQYNTPLSAARVAEIKENGNLKGLINNFLTDFEIIVKKDTLQNNAFEQFLTNLLPENVERDAIGLGHWKTELSINIDSQAILRNKTLAEKVIENNIFFFGINIPSLLYEPVAAIFKPLETTLVSLPNPRGYFAKVNYAYLIANNKKIYAGEIPNDSLNIDNFVKNLDDDFKIDINGLQFIIVGQETSVDYMYPVLDENNLQVDTHNQALIYVNQYGFNRVKKAYSGNLIKQVLLVKNPHNIVIPEVNGTKPLTNEQLRNQLREIVREKTNNNSSFERVFLASEIDPINPECALRINTIQKVINGISVITTLLVALLSVLVTFSVVFIIKRYIASKNKVLGILEAQGYTPSQIACSLFVFAIVTSIIGGLMGYIVGNRFQLIVMDFFSAYWTLPKSSLDFNYFGLFNNMLVPFILVSVIIYIVTLWTLRVKPLDLITANNTMPNSKRFWKFYWGIRKSGIRSRFSLILAYTGLTKLIPFMISIILVATAALFGLSNRTVFKNTIENTYKNRDYKFKLDLVTPTVEGGIYRSFNGSNVANELYTPIGFNYESQSEIRDYLKPGHSSIINSDKPVKQKNSDTPPYSSPPYNGEPTTGEPHLLTQFSLDIVVDAAVTVNPWQVSYSLMADTQKTRIDSIRNRIGWQLEKTQNGLVADGKTWEFIKDSNTQAWYFVNKDNHNEYRDYYKYYVQPGEKSGSFKLAKWNPNEQTYELEVITTTARDAYRAFLVRGYEKIQEQINAEKKDPSLIKVGPNNEEATKPQPYRDFLADYQEFFGPTINDYFISFGGVYYDENDDEKYSYIETNRGKIFGYKQDSRFIKAEALDGTNLLTKIYNFDTQNNTIFPLVINEVVAAKNKWGVGTEVTLTVKNHVRRYINKFLANGEEPIYQYKFKVIGINQTFINEEMLTSQHVANLLTGMTELAREEKIDYEPFNGILSKATIPQQILGSASLYSQSGYWPIMTENFGPDKDEAVFEQFFHYQNGLLISNLMAGGLTRQEAIAKWAAFLTQSPPSDLSNESVLEKIYSDNKKNNANTKVHEFIKLYDSYFYGLVAKTIDSKDIELGFINSIGGTVSNVSTGIIVVMIFISLTILVIISTLIINENQRNIAIFSILGYSEKEKLIMFFSIFIPFLIGSLLLSIPIVMGVMFLFNFFMLKSSIVLVFSMSPVLVLLVFLVSFLVFAFTSLITWYSIGKIKAVELLKG